MEQKLFRKQLIFKYTLVRHASYARYFPRKLDLTTMRDSFSLLFQAEQDEFRDFTGFVPVALSRARCRYLAIFNVTTGSFSAVVPTIRLIRLISFESSFITRSG